MTPADDPVLRMQSALALLEAGLARMHRERAKYHPTWYAALMEGTTDDICKVRADIDAYIGLTEFATSAALRSPMPAADESAREPAAQQRRPA